MNTSYISNRELKFSEAVKGDEIREEIFNLIKKDYPGFKTDDHISLPELNKYRRNYFSSLLNEGEGEIKSLHNEVVDAIRNNSILSENIEDTIDEELTTGQKIADKIASFGGSWTFIVTFFSFIILWMGINVYLLTTRAFDPYPFILLNLILSCIAAIQAPIIMMSQNRQEDKDRKRSEHDYKINLKAELEIKLLHDKMDHLLLHQNNIMLKMQQIQIDYLDELVEIKEKRRK